MGRQKQMKLDMIREFRFKWRLIGGTLVENMDD